MFCAASATTRSTFVLPEYSVSAWPALPMLPLSAFSVTEPPRCVDEPTSPAVQVAALARATPMEPCAVSMTALPAPASTVLMARSPVISLTITWPLLDFAVSAGSESTLTHCDDV